jgi:putative ABC transport system substrate-binding protein
MMRRSFIAFAAASLIMPSALNAQQRGKIRRIGLLGISAPTPETLNLSLEPLRQRLRELGWIEGHNIVIEQRWAQGKAERYPELAAELVRLKVDVIVTPSTEAAMGVRKATQTVPIVGTFLGDPVRFGLVKSYARPGGNVTGLTSEAGGLPISAKTLEFLKQAVPTASRIAVLVNPKSDLAGPLLEDIEPAAKALKIELVAVEAGTPDQLERAFARMQEGRVDALYILSNAMLFAHRARIAELAIKHRLPAGGSMAQFAQAGGLVNYVMDVSDNYRRAADYVDKILKGANPGDLPIEQPTKFQLLVNLKTARSLRLTIPQSLLVRADRVIE